MDEVCSSGRCFQGEPQRAVHHLAKSARGSIKLFGNNIMDTKNPIADFLASHPEVESISLKITETCFDKASDKPMSDTRKYSAAHFPSEIRPVFVFNCDFHMMNTERNPVNFAMAALDNGGSYKKKKSLAGFPDEYLFYSREIECVVKTK